jgi:hypothetical protein
MGSVRWRVERRLIQIRGVSRVLGGPHFAVLGILRNSRMDLFEQDQRDD